VAGESAWLVDLLRRENENRQIGEKCPESLGLNQDKDKKDRAKQAAVEMEQ